MRKGQARAELAPLLRAGPAMAACRVSQPQHRARRLHPSIRRRAFLLLSDHMPKSPPKRRFRTWSCAAAKLAWGRSQRRLLRGLLFAFLGVCCLCSSSHGGGIVGCIAHGVDLGVGSSRSFGCRQRRSLGRRLSHRKFVCRHFDRVFACSFRCIIGTAAGRQAQGCCGDDCEACVLLHRISLFNPVHLKRPMVAGAGVSSGGSIGRPMATQTFVASARLQL
ncbi:hypothetical protein SAMN06272759_106225 [Novosphingobium sp. B1]|nr:hypothetical protein SAMN06272759_106225 [Novosphingobium sp. B1]